MAGIFKKAAEVKAFPEGRFGRSIIILPPHRLAVWHGAIHLPIQAGCKNYGSDWNLPAWQASLRCEEVPQAADENV
jgi:hypothetical protein